MLTHDNEKENEYVLPEGHSCWITVGDKSVYITNNAGISGQTVEVYQLGKEDQTPIDTINLEPMEMNETNERVNMLGQVGNPIICDIPEEAWEPTGDFGEDANGNPSDARTRLSCTVRFAGIMMHVEAFEVKGSSKGRCLKAVNPDLEIDIERLWGMAGWEGGKPDLLEIQGRTYILTMYPLSSF